MRVKNLLLELGVGRLAVERQFFNPEAKSLPMDKKDDLKGNKRKFKGEPKKAGGGQGAAFSSKGTQENLGPFRAGPIVDVDVEMFVGNVEIEIKVEVQLAVRRDVEQLGRDKPEGRRR